MISWWFNHESRNEDPPKEKPSPKKRKREPQAHPASTIETRLGTKRRLSGVKKEVALRPIAIRPLDQISSVDHSYWWCTGKGGQGIQTGFFGGVVEF